MTPAPSPIDVFLHTGPAEWWQVAAAFGPLAVLLAAAIGAAISWRTLRQRTIADREALDQRRTADANALDQKTEADSRAEWWRRTQWALDRALDDDEDVKALGLAALDVLARSTLARTEELELLDIAWKSVNNAPAAAPEPPAGGSCRRLLRRTGSRLGRWLGVMDARDHVGDNGLTDTEADADREVQR